MSQRDVQSVIGRLACDEGSRKRFAQDRVAFLDQLIDQGLSLTPVERSALLATDCAACEDFAGRLDPRIQKIDLMELGGPVVGSRFGLRIGSAAERDSTTAEGGEQVRRALAGVAEGVR